MRPERVAELLHKVKYRAGWTFEVRALPGELTIRVEATVRDSDGGREPIKLYASKRVSDAVVDSLDEFRLWGLVEILINQIEGHEMREWLRVDGEPVIDPHPEIPKGSAKFQFAFDMMSDREMTETEI